MQFIIHNIQANLSTYKGKVLKNAILLIKAHNITPGEQKLNNYLLSHYQMNLKQICLYLLARCKFYRNYNNELVILFPEQICDDVAALITYGNNELKGSSILKDAFIRD